MNCPNCGAETNDSICPVCGAALDGGSGFTLAGNDQPQRGADASYGGDVQQNAYGAPEYENYQQPFQNDQMPQKKKSGMGAAIGIIIALVVVAAVAVVLFLFVFNNGPKKSKDLVDQFMTGIEEGDTDKIVDLVDSDCVGESDVQTLSDGFALLKSMGIEYTMDYEITSTEKANKATIESMCEGLYGDEDVAKDVKSAYICEVDYTMEMSYLGETESQDDTMSLICYKKDGKWYVGGTVE